MGWTPTWNISITQTLLCLNKKNLCLSRVPSLLTLQLDLSPVTVDNLGWQRACRERKLERKDGGEGGNKKNNKKKTVHPPEKKNFRRSFQVRCRSQGEGEGGVILHLGSPGVCGARVQPLYVSWFRKVGDESYHYPDIHASAYSDGEGGEEQSPSGRDVGQREVTFVHRLGGLEEKEMQKGKKKVRNSLKGPRERERDWPIFQKEA